MQDEVFWSLRRRVASLSFNPPPQHWLESDCSVSYCWDCAVQVRAAEMGKALPYKSQAPYYARDDVEEGIDGGSWYSATSDSTVTCGTCGRTLHFWLTEEGIDQEIVYINDCDWLPNVREDAYLIDRLFECSEEQWPDVKAIAERFLRDRGKTAPDLPGGSS